MKKLFAFLLACLLLPVLTLSAAAASYTVYSQAGLVESVHMAAGSLSSDFSLIFEDSEGLYQRWSCSPDYVQELMSGAGILSCTYTMGVNPVQVHVEIYYPGTRIVNAWRTGNTAGLSVREQETLQAARSLIDSCGAAYAGDPYRTVLDALIARTSYDTATYLSAQLGNGFYENDTAIGALLNGRADCDGYADACVLLFSLLGGEVRYMSVTLLSGISHMVVQLNKGGQWRIVDACQEDGGDLPLNQYYGITTEQARQMYTWNEALYAGYLG